MSSFESVARARSRSVLLPMVHDQSHTDSSCTGRLRDNGFALPTRAHRHNAQWVFVTVAWSSSWCCREQLAGSGTGFRSAARAHRLCARTAYGGW